MRTVRCANRCATSVSIMNEDLRLDVEKVSAMEKLKPCPRCGDAWLYERDEPKPYTINCKCGYAFYVTEWSETKEEATAAWNRRANDEQIH